MLSLQNVRWYHRTIQCIEALGRGLILDIGLECPVHVNAQGLQVFNLSLLLLSGPLDGAYLDLLMGVLDLTVESGHKLSTGWSLGSSLVLFKSSF